jgi:hypothetical protein
MRETPRRTPIMRDGTISATRDKADRSTVELLTVCVSDSHGTSSRTQLRTDDAKLARETISLIDRNFCIFEDHTALVFEIFADDEVEIEVGHWNHLPSFQLYEN